MASTVWKGHLTFGLVSIPVRLYKAARPEKISFHQLRKVPAAASEPERAPEPVSISKSRGRAPEPAPESGPEPDQEPESYVRVHQQLVTPESSAPVSRAQVVKGYEYEKNRYVVIPDEDIKSIAPKTGTAMEIGEFVKLSDIDPVYFETSYYVAPDEGGEKAYSLLFQALKESGYVALAEVAMHRREHVMVIRPGERGLIAHTMFYASEIRSDQEFRTTPGEVKPKELQLAKQLVESLVAPFEPQKYKDKFHQKVQAMIDARIAGKEVAKAPEPKKTAEVVDIMEALKKSLSAVRKPPAAAPTKSRRAAQN
jgi:DNA end-binding protein Ku